ncbi:archaeosortase/exosortase family protein [Phycisphaera mikurensis]|uniref:Uncharacterized protein n=1 Tax=Phycisphaera mikurensis (strain NBRC 102666 / KCTC 22515 / FYK2301M01) TaxID=1142394 RepID=I0IBJ0_PHYMF|nr:archaeosortase/exosortase family protein [Phycisphaera mikurensis]MBB6442841.1 hypothetical protein [Phycisphaera mikurensis]BAM02628.1 hypothetical protein PSMK_04690 [Phycisphaera mikurensis NBRC 102666]
MPWRLTLLGLAAAGAMLLALPAWVACARAALGHEADAGILIAPVVFVFLVTLRWRRLVVLRPRPDALGVAVAALGVVLLALATADPLGGGSWFLGGPLFRGGPAATWARTAAVGGAVLLLLGSITAVTGHRLAGRFGAAMGALVFLVPLPQSLITQVSEPMNLAAARVACGIFEVFSVGAGVEGGTMFIERGAGQRWMPVPLAETAQALPIAMMLGVVCYAFVFGSPLRPLVRTAVLLLCPIAGVLSCAGVLVATLLFSTPEAPAWAWAQVGGQWLMMAVAFLLLMGLIRLLAWAAVPVRRFSLAN